MIFKWNKHIKIVTVTIYFFVHVSPTAADEPALTISPQLCIVNDAGNVCEALVKVHWHSKSNETLCLYQNTQKHACWQNTPQGAFELSVVAQNDVVFSLKDGVNVVASVAFKVNYLKPTNTRRRLRSEWSIF